MLSQNKTEPVIELVGVSKRYWISQLTDMTNGTTNKQSLNANFWALKDINLTINKGEVVGLIGANGAGKSTLLKLLSGISKPSSGIIKLRGSVGSMLEMGTGFNPDLTGRENIYINGALRGFSKAEIDRHYDLIVRQSGIEKFIDTPVKHYSSGMFVRLAFSLLAHLQSDILLFDEINAVGDILFVKKSAESLQKMISNGGTVVLASHNLSDVATMCSRCIILEKGQIVFDGSPNDALDKYISQSLKSSPFHANGAFVKGETTTLKQASNEENELRQEMGDEEVNSHIIKGFSVTLSDKRQQVCDTFFMSDCINISVAYTKLVSAGVIDVVLQIANYAGIVLSDCIIYRSEYRDSGTETSGKYMIECSIPPHLFNTGTYYVHIWMGDRINRIARFDYAASFKIKSDEWEKNRKWNEGPNSFPFRPHLKWNKKHLPE